MSYLKIPIHTHPFTVASYEPFERVEMDTIGPLPEDEEGYKYILVIIDCFTRWVSLYPIKDTTAVECAKRMISHVGIFGSNPGSDRPGIAVRKSVDGRSIPNYRSIPPDQPSIL